ncbi:signal peptidase I [Candidatus Bathyarchaeota archaeon]|nr:signal peptidase I [Candidatus Bathyarchaeota archaeon]
MSVYYRKFRAFLRKNETARGLFLVGIVILGAVAVWGGIRLALNTPYPILVVSSSSMCQSDHPELHSTQCTLPIGALIVIRGEDPATIPNGTIIVFMNDPANPGFLVVHRVIGIVPAASSAFKQVSFKTQGDANIAPDSWTQYGYIPASWVIGVYQFTIPIPYLGSAILSVRDFMYNSTTGQVNPQGILVILALVVALFAFEVMEPGKKHSSDRVPEDSKESAQTGDSKNSAPKQ